MPSDVVPSRSTVLECIHGPSGQDSRTSRHRDAASAATRVGRRWCAESRRVLRTDRGVTDCIKAFHRGLDGKAKASGDHEPSHTGLDEFEEASVKFA